MPETVYVVLRKNPDVKDHMAEIKGIFKDKAEAMKFRQQRWDLWEETTEVQAYFLTDTV